ncbi:MAG TPA: peptidoglycan recognition family protein [Tepidisphaeraceae bacterium]|nr:peptidoglycan recognition family protein [Tepidisphaeraceae bacterium]
MTRSVPRLTRLILLLVSFATITGCASRGIKPGTRLERKGDEIVVAGQLFHTGAPVVLWMDPGGYDAYRTERRFAPWEEASYGATTRAATTRPRIGIYSPNRYGLRESVLTDEQRQLVRGGGWPLELLQDKVDQFVIHYDVAGTSRQCFLVLHDLRNLSVQFMLDIDGTIYQTMDAKERAWHAGEANSRSVGIEIANMGAYASGEAEPFKQWYGKDENGRTRITVPQRLGDGGVRTPNFVGYPVRDELVVGEVQGRARRQYDLTKEQYDSLIKLTATLCTVLPKIDPDYPRDEQGRLINHVLTEEQYDNFSGVLGHYHVTSNKSDPGPAFQWDYVIDNARKLMGKPPKPKRGKVTTPPTEPMTRPTTQPSGVAMSDGGTR